MNKELRELFEKSKLKKKEFCINLPWASPEEKWISSPDEVVFCICFF